AALHGGHFPYATSDGALMAAAAAAKTCGNLAATTDADAYALAAIAIVDVHLDVVEDAAGIRADTSVLEAAVRTLGARLPAGALVIVETTVPPGTCERVVAPILAAACAERGLAADAIALAHSYERVMPGPDYLRSITNFWRVYAGRDDAAAAACAAFLEKVINVRDYPLRRLASMTASETAKVLENSYRAANIAFIDEWGRLAEAWGIDLFEVLDAVRDRPTHDNIRQPGFGVGGYCLTKDPLLPLASARAFLPGLPLDFPFAELAVRVNRAMPAANLARITALLGGSLAGRALLLMGVAYRAEVDDTRYAPAAAFYHAAVAAGATVRCHDPLVRHWDELDLAIAPALPPAEAVDAIVFAVPHAAYRELDVVGWLGAARPLVYDCDNVLPGTMRATLRAHGCRVESTGRGLGL
ncbi:MAG: nucleotide sugar dehydrogenase, partial [Gammaproteobacteria bacterium]